MENASEALVVAGGILIAVLILSLVFQMIRILGNTEKSKVDVEDASKLSDWNAQWEAYNRKLLYGSDVITVINKALQNNSEFESIDEYKIDMSIEIVEQIGTAKVRYNKTLDNITIDDNTLNDFKENIKESIFECTQMAYSNTTGRINFIEFKEK